MPDHNGGDLGGVTIGAREIYDLVNEVRGEVRSLAMTDEHAAAKLADVVTEQGKQGERIYALERWMWAIPAALVTGVASVVTVILTALYIK